ncbi:MAG: hypothetical protein IPO21_04145 [Bacteroidales bacterium]|nr:hypothetical protein [Bacteroidales bacterium]
MIIVLLWFYKDSILGKIVEKFEFAQKYRSQISNFSEPARAIQYIVLSLSFARYVVFSSQFALCVFLFIPNISIEECLLCIGATYLFTTIIPTFALAEFGIRGPIAVAIFSLYNYDALSVFSATILVWVINLAIPAALGSVLMLSNKKKANSNYSPHEL